MFPMKLHVAQDDMESFVILVLYYSLRYVKHNAFNIKDIMLRVFDDGNVGPDGYSRGGKGKRALFLLREDISKNFHFTNNKPLTQWIDYAIDSVGEWQTYVNPPPSRFGRLHEATPMDQLQLRNHQQLIDAWTDVLAMPDWPPKDKTADQCPKTSEGSTVTSKRNNPNHDGEEDENEDVPKRKKSRTNIVPPSSRTLRSRSSGKRRLHC
jgi:hypothetical protein